jgi:hypothetical protein
MMLAAAAPLLFELSVPDLTPWRAGNTGTPGVWQFDSGVSGRHVMISALVHGNELCGAWALKGLLEAGVRPAIGRLTLAFCNLDAFDRFDANHPDDSRQVDEDLNRQWSLDRMQTANTLERRRADALCPFVQSADWLLDLHSMHERAEPLMLTGMQTRNLALAKQMQSPAYIVVDAGHADGVRMRDFGRFGHEQPPLLGANGLVHDCHSLLVECGFHGDLSSRCVAQDQCVRFLRAAQLMDAATERRLLAGWRLPDAMQQWMLTVDGAVVAKDARFRFDLPFQGLETIARAGTVIGYYSDSDDDPVVTPFDDCVLVMPSVRQARAGVTVVRFAHRSPLV